MQNKSFAVLVAYLLAHEEGSKDKDKSQERHFWSFSSWVISSLSSWFTIIVLMITCSWGGLDKNQRCPASFLGSFYRGAQLSLEIRYYLYFIINCHKWHNCVWKWNICCIWLWIATSGTIVSVNNIIFCIWLWIATSATIVFALLSAFK